MSCWNFHVYVSISVPQNASLLQIWKACWLWITFSLLLLSEQMSNSKHASLWQIRHPLLGWSSLFEAFCITFSIVPVHIVVTLISATYATRLDSFFISLVFLIRSELTQKHWTAPPSMLSCKNRVTAYIHLICLLPHTYFKRIRYNRVCKLSLLSFWNTAFKQKS